MAGEVVSQEGLEPPLDVPSAPVRISYTKRIRENWPSRPLLRTHYGEPGDTIEPTVAGIRMLSKARVLDEISLGSSNLSQWYYSRPEMWEGRENDGGVPYKTFQDLLDLRAAALCGNFPGMKPYAHVNDSVAFVDECLKAGMLTGSHQAVPLYWFNQMDGRGPSDLLGSIHEHIATVRQLAARGIPVEMNDPNHWSSRWASDAVMVADYGLIASVMLNSGVKDMILQMQFNKPKETSDAGDLAKFSAALELVRSLIPPGQEVTVWVETRTGIDHFEPDLEIAKRQLARSTLLQMNMQPHVIHLVSYCEALYAARPEDIINASTVIRRAVRCYNDHHSDIERAVDLPIIRERKAELLREAGFILKEIARLNRGYSERSGAGRHLYEYLADPECLYAAVDRGYMTAPGIFTEPYRRYAEKAHTDVFSGGFINSMDPRSLLPITEEQRMALL